MLDEPVLEKALKNWKQTHSRSQWSSDHHSHSSWAVEAQLFTQRGSYGEMTFVSLFLGL